MSTFTIARLTFLEAARRKILLAALLLGLLFLIIYGLGFHFLMIRGRKSRSEYQSVAAKRNPQFLVDGRHVCRELPDLHDDRVNLRGHIVR